MSSEISLNSVLKALHEILDDKSQSTSVETGEYDSVASNASDADFFIKEANASFQSMGSIFEWLGRKLEGVTNDDSKTINKNFAGDDTLTNSVAKSYSSMVKDLLDNYAAATAAATSDARPSASTNITYATTISANNTKLASENTNIQSVISQLHEDEMDDLARPSSLATSVKTQLDKKNFVEDLLKPLLRPKLKRIQVLIDDMTSIVPASSSSSSSSTTSTLSLDNSKSFYDMMNDLMKQKNGLFQKITTNQETTSQETMSQKTTISELFKNASTSMKEKIPDQSQKSDSLYNVDESVKIKFHQNLRKAVAVAASMIIDVNNIVISIGQHISGEDNTLGGAIFFKLDKDGTVLEQLHSAIFKDSNEYDKFVTLAGGDRNNLWIKNDGNLTGEIQLDNIPPEVAKLRAAVNNTKNNKPTVAGGSNNNITKKYYKRATRTKRPRRLGRRTR